MTTAVALPHIPVLRLGKTYESMDQTELKSVRGGDPVARVSKANAALIRRDMRKIGQAFDTLQSIPCAKMIEIFQNASHYFMNESLPLNEEGETQSPDEYMELLHHCSGLPYSLIKKNMLKINEVLTEIDTIVSGLTRGLDLSILDSGLGEQDGSMVSFYPTTQCMGAVLPSNSPGVNSIWLPAIALRIPVIIKPGREEPWTPYRIIQSLIAAGCPPEAFGFYATDHEGSATILQSCDRGIIFGDEKTIERYANNPAIQVHGPGWSKILIGEDEVENWQEHIDVIARSIYENGGRSCINASAVLTPKYGREIADALAQKLAALEPRPHDDPDAVLAGFANPAVAEYIDAAVSEGLETPGAEDMTAHHRAGERRVTVENSVYLLPTVVHCESFSHPLANREFLFPYASVIEMPQEAMLDTMGPSLVVTAITKDHAWIKDLLRSKLIERLNIGPMHTSRVTWDQPHEGNLFEFLYKRRAIQKAI